MTTTDRTATTSEPPAWLNLDGYCPPELRDRIAEAREHIAEMYPRIVDLAREIAAVLLDFEVHTGRVDLFDGHDQALDPWTGRDSLWTETRELENILGYALDDGDGPAPDWYLDLVAERLDGLSTWAPWVLAEGGRISSETAEECRQAILEGRELPFVTTATARVCVECARPIEREIAVARADGTEHTCFECVEKVYLAMRAARGS